MKSIIWILNNRIFFLMLYAILLIFALIPYYVDGTIILGGEGNYILDFSTHLSRYKFMWRPDGVGLPNMAPSWAGLNISLLWSIEKLTGSTAITNFVLIFSIYFLPFWGMYLVCKEIKTTPFISFLCSLFYVVNPFILYYLIYLNQWNVFVVSVMPFFLWIVLKYYHSNFKLFFLFGLISTCFSFTYANPPLFGIVLISILLSIFIASCYHNNEFIPTEIIKKYTILHVSFIAFNFWWILNLFIAIPAGQKLYQHSYAESWLNTTTTNYKPIIAKMFSFTVLLSLTEENPSYDFFTYWYSTIFSKLITLIPILLMVYFILIVKNKRTRNLLNLATFGVLLVVLFFVKGNARPFGFIYEFAFKHLPFFDIFKSPVEKFGLLYVFIFSILLLFVMYDIKNHKYYKPAIAVFIAYLFFCCVPIITGNIIPENDRGMSRKYKDKEEYKQFREEINNDVLNYRLLSLPGSVNYQVSMLNWNNRYYTGMDPIIMNINKDSITSYGASDLSLLFRNISLPNYRKLLGMYNIRKIMINEDLFPWFGYVQSERVSELKKTFGKSMASKKWGGITLYDNQDYFLPRIYSALAITPVTGDINSLIPLTQTSFLDDYPALAFTEQQNKNSLSGLIGLTASEKRSGIEGQRQKAGKILFANGSFNDLLIDLAKAEVQEDGQRSTSISQKSVFAKLNNKGKAKIEIKEAGVYEIWVKVDDKFIKEVDIMQVGGETYPIEKENMNGRWLKIGVKEFKVGSQKVELIRKEKEAKNLQTDVVIISEKKRKEYEEILESKDISYFFYKEEDNTAGSLVSKVIDKRDFYIPKSGDYEIRAFIKPKREKVRAYAVKEDFKEDISMDWNLRINDNLRSAVSSQQYQNHTPVFFFGENFYPPQTFSYPLMDGMWRWMSQDGEVIIFNPFNASVSMDISFSIVSFKEKREVHIILNDELLKTLALPGTDEKVDKRSLKEATDLKVLSWVSGKPEKVELKSLFLVPGINRMVLKSIPSAEVVGRDDRFFVSVAVSDDFRMRLSSKEIDQSTTYWKNRSSFEVKTEDGFLIFKDDYKGDKEEIGWVTRRFDGIDLYETPLFILKYLWSDDNEVQAMDIGFRIDMDGDGKEDLDFTRNIPDSISDVNTFEIDLLEEMWKVFPDITTGKAFLVGIDLFPHRKWGSKVSGTIKEGIYNYSVKGIQVASRDASVVDKKSSFKGLKLSEKATYTMSKDYADLKVSLPLGGRKGDYASTELRIPLENELFKKATTMALPFHMADEDVQGISLWIGYDNSGDGKADRFLPAGISMPLLRWRLATKETTHGFWEVLKPKANSPYPYDMKEPMLLYESRLPEGFPTEYTTKGNTFNNFIVLKDGQPLSPTWDNDFRMAKEQVQVDGKRVVINLSRDKDPDSYNYELYYVPQRWVIDSQRFPGFKEYDFEIEEMKEQLPDNNATPVELKLVLTGRISNFRNEEKKFKFYFKSPRYTHMGLPRLKSIEQEKNMPVFKIDDGLVEFVKKEMDNEKEGIWLKGVGFFKEGNHTLDVRDEGALEAYMVEIKPVSSQQSAVSSQKPPEINFKKINLTRYVVDAKGAKEPFTLVFSESFHKGWKAYIRQKPEVRSQKSEEDQKTTEPWSALWSAWKDRDNRIEIKGHFVMNGYANGWIVPVGQFRVPSSEFRVKDAQDFEIMLEYKPQRLFEIGLIISAITLLGCVGYFGYGFVSERGKND